MEGIGASGALPGARDASRRRVRPTPVRALCRRRLRGKCNAFFDKLVRRGYARASDCIHNRARLYHVHHKSLYHVIGEATSRYRRPVSPRLAIEWLMLLGAVLTTPDLECFTVASEKVAHLAKLTASAGAAATPEVPPEPASGPAVGLPGALPIGLASDGRTILLYLATEPWTDGFRSFLQGHAALLRVAPSWTLRLVFPRPFDRSTTPIRPLSARNWSRLFTLPRSAS